MIVDLFAGPGGWDTAAAGLGLDVVGVELDPGAISTRIAAGHSTIRGDLLEMAPRPSRALIASPPCPAFSAAGKKRGVTDIPELVAMLTEARWTTDRPWNDPSSELIVRTAQWAHLAEEWVALEQVPAVLPAWEAIASGLIAAGWASAWAGVLNCADYGVPQTRKRAFMLAHRTNIVTAPPATHAKVPGMFDEPWVTMADALSWPQGHVGFGRKYDGRGEQIDGKRARDYRPTGQPAHALTEKARSWTLTPGSWADGRGGNRRTYDDTEPAPTLAFGNDYGAWQWTLNTGRDWKPGGTRDDAQKLPPTVPAPTVTGLSGGQWIFGDITEPIKMEPWQAGVLQSFPADYPWQGSRTAQFKQIGNAVPPLMADHILRAVQPDERNQQ